MSAAVRWAIVFVLVVARVDAVADLVDTERLEAWEQWRDQPLDLRTAPPEELEVLPGSDPVLARAIDALRTARPDFTRDDLLAVDGIDEHLLDSWDELVVYGTLHGARVDASIENGASRVAARVRRDDWTVGGIVRDRPRVARGWIDGRLGRLRVLAGALRLSFGSGVGVGDVLGRSRSGAAARPRTAVLRGRTDGGDQPGWTGVALGADVRAGRLDLVVAEDDARRPVVVVGWNGAEVAGVQSGLVVIGREDRGRVAAWSRREVAEGLEVWGEGVSDPRLRAGATSLGLRARGRGWNVGAAWARTSSSSGDGRDPVTGAALDRDHTVRQLDGNARRGPYRLDVWWRHRTRGGATDERVRADLTWTRPRTRDGDARWTARAGVELDEDFEVDGAVDPRLRWEVERTTAAWRVRVTWARRGPARDAAEAIGLRARRRLDAGPLVAVEAGLAAASTARSSPWFVPRPVAGVRPLWVPASGHATWLVAHARTRAVETGVWAWWRGPVDEGAVGFGVAVRATLGSMVRRLH